MRLDEIMSGNPLIVEPEEKIVEVARAMRTRRTSSALVAHEGKLEGIVTERDFAHKVVAEGLSPEGAVARDLMTPDPVTAPPRISPWEALSLMTVKGVRHLPVCDDGKPVGVLSLDELASTGGSASTHRLLDGMDEATRARVLEILVWCAEQVGLRRSDYPMLAGLD